MNDRDRMKNLKVIADLLRDRDLAALSHAQADKARTQDLIRALDHTTVPALPESAAVAQVAEKYGLWAANRRIMLNQQNARDTVRCMAEREAAQQSFGRAEVLGKLLARK